MALSPAGPALAAAPHGPPQDQAAAARQATRPPGIMLAQAGRPGGPRLPDAPQELLPAPQPTPVSDNGLTGPRAACLAAARRAERVHGLPHGLLVAVALSESGLHAHALNIAGRSHFPEDAGTARRLLQAAPAGASVMAGCVQVNARVHARGRDWPLDPVLSADWAGGMLQRWHRETGSWTEALRRWHGGSARSTQHVLCRVRAKLEVTAPGSAILSGNACPDSEIARMRRDGAALLEVAEMP